MHVKRSRPLHQRRRAVRLRPRLPDYIDTEPARRLRFVALVRVVGTQRPYLRAILGQERQAVRPRALRLHRCDDSLIDAPQRGEDEAAIFSGLEQASLVSQDCFVRRYADHEAISEASRPSQVFGVASVEILEAPAHKDGRH